jgi:hypothetical protein
MHLEEHFYKSMMLEFWKAHQEAGYYVPKSHIYYRRVCKKRGTDRQLLPFPTTLK